MLSEDNGFFSRASRTYLRKGGHIVAPRIVLFLLMSKFFLKVVLQFASMNDISQIKCGDVRAIPQTKFEAFFTTLNE